MALTALLVLIFILVVASVIDVVYGEVPNIITMLGVLVPSVIFFIQTTELISLEYKIYFMICIIVMYLGIMWAGEILVTKQKIGGADIKILASLSPALVAMGYIGALYLFWFFVINPITNNIVSKKSIGANGLLSTIKLRFVPYMTLVFIILTTMRSI